MAAPAVIAIKIAAQVAINQIQKKYPGGLTGFIATIVIVGIMFVMVVAGLVMGLMSAIVPQSNDLSDACVVFPEGNSISVGLPPDDGDNAGSGGGGSDNTQVSDYTGDIVMPVQSGKYTLASNYGPRTSPTAGASSWHKGIDLSAPLGTPILAVADGVVTVTAKKSTGLGQSINVKHKINGQVWITRYGHTTNSTLSVKVGDQVTAGQKIAHVGNTGTSTGPHLHFEVWKNYVDYTNNHVDPEKWLSSNGAITVKPTGGGGGSSSGQLSGDAQYTQICEVEGQSGGGGGGAGPWGGHENGKIPANALCKIPGYKSSGHLLRCDAATSFAQLNNAYKDQFGTNISITDTYRTYSQQVALKKQKPFLAGKPGTSNHGWGMAVDLGGGIQNFGSAQYKWMLSNAGTYGWIAPDWARQGGSKPEAWHWEYGGSSGTGNGDASNASGAKQVARSMLGGYGWSSDEMACLEPMWTKESNWNYKAANPTSTARGIPQMMMSVHYGSNWSSSSAGKKYLSDPKVQIGVGLEYIKGRYGSPCKAWSFWQKNHWY